MATNDAASTVVLANACDLVFTIFQGVAGNDVANTLNGEKLSRDVINNITLAHINSELSNSQAGV